MKMKKFAKILAMILICTMLGTALLACGPSHKDWEDIESKSKMIIGITDFRPMNYKDGNGEWIGFETEFAKAVCAILGVEPEFIEIDWNAKETELAAKSIDAIWNGMTITEQRAKEMDISTAYVNNVPVLVVRAADKEKYQTADDLTGVVLVAEMGSTLEECIQANAIFANANYTAVDKQITGVLEVKAGTADMTVIDSIMAVEVLRPGGDFTDLVYIDRNFARESFGIAFRKNSPETLKKVNEAIAELKLNGTLQAIADKYNLTDFLIK